MPRFRERPMIARTISRLSLCSLIEAMKERSILTRSIGRRWR